MTVQHDERCALRSDPHVRRGHVPQGLCTITVTSSVSASHDLFFAEIDLDPLTLFDTSVRAKLERALADRWELISQGRWRTAIPSAALVRHRARIGTDPRDSADVVLLIGRTLLDWGFAVRTTDAQAQRDLERHAGGASTRAAVAAMSPTGLPN